jgi:hypothetical protein
MLPTIRQPEAHEQDTRGNAASVPRPAALGVGGTRLGLVFCVSGGVDIDPYCLNHGNNRKVERTPTPLRGG